MQGRGAPLPVRESLNPDLRGDCAVLCFASGGLVTRKSQNLTHLPEGTEPFMDQLTLTRYRSDKKVGAELEHWLILGTMDSPHDFTAVTT